MSKKAKTIFMLVGAGVVALLIVLALFGNTYARYTSTGDGGGTMSVALWDLESTSSWDASGTVGTIKPSDAKYSEGEEARTNDSMDWLELFTVTNKSDVKACVELSGGSDITLDWADGFEWGVGWASSSDIDENGNPVSDRAQSNTYAQKLMARFEDQDAFETVVKDNGVFTLQIGYGDDKDNVTETTSGVTLSTEAENDGFTSCTFWCKIAWKSVYSTDSNLPKDDNEEEWSSWEEYSDAVDTLLCMYVKSVSFSTAWKAYQASAT